jgi:protein tyrosine phosphatase
MCSKYWPDEIDQPEYHAPIEVTLLAEEHLAEFTVRTFRIKRRFTVTTKSGGINEKLTDNLVEKTMRMNLSANDDKNSRGSPARDSASNNQGSNAWSDVEKDGRIIHQFQFFQWPIHSCPSIDSLLHFRRRVRVTMEHINVALAEIGRKAGPPVIHCSDGCGRTGAYLAIDANLELAEEDNSYDVFGYARKMRSARRGMIESATQYKFIYETLQEARLTGKTWFPVFNLAEMIKKKSQSVSVLKGGVRINEYQREYDKIVKMTRNYSIGDCAGGHRVENRYKNRDFATIPPDNYRPYLSTFQSNDSTDYVNAVFVDGYTRSKEYIVTEWPMKHTIPDCWSLIYDHDCNSVVVLSSPSGKFFVRQ